MWTKFTGVLIWKTQNPWTGLRGQFYDHLQDQTAGFYGCRCAAEPIHVQLNLSNNLIEVTLPENLVDSFCFSLKHKSLYYKHLELAAWIIFFLLTL